MKEKGRRVVLYYPLFFLRRWSMMLILLISPGESVIQMNIMINLNVAAIWAYGWMRPHDSRVRRNMEYFNEFMFMILNYMMVSMT